MQLLDTLNSEQREAVLHIKGPLLILAGAGVMARHDTKPRNEPTSTALNAVVDTGDLKSAVVYISIFGNTEQKKTALELLQKNRVLIQAHVSKNVVLKYTPRLKFVADGSASPAASGAEASTGCGASAIATVVS